VDKNALKWDGMAAEFDASSTPVFAEVADNKVIAWPVVLELIKKYARKGGPLKILDFGCGAGWLCQELHEAGCKVVGVDFSKAMIDIAGKNSPSEIEYVVGDQTVLKSFASGFDAITSIMVLQFVDDAGLASIVRSVHKALKPNGIMVIAIVNPAFVANCIENKVRFKKIACKTADKFVLSFKPGVSFNVFMRNANAYNAIFSQAGFTELNRRTPAFPPGFSEEFGWTLPTNVPEFLIMAFRKK